MKTLLLLLGILQTTAAYYKIPAPFADTINNRVATSEGMNYYCEVQRDTVSNDLYVGALYRTVFPAAFDSLKTGYYGEWADTITYSTGATFINY